MPEEYLCEQIKKLSGRLGNIFVYTMPRQGRKVKESHLAHDVADKCKIGRKNQGQQAAHKPVAGSTANKSQQAITYKQ